LLLKGKVMPASLACVSLNLIVGQSQRLRLLLLRFVPSSLVWLHESRHCLPRQRMLVASYLNPLLVVVSLLEPRLKSLVGRDIKVAELRA